jgi:flagellar biogenesis protein FliO
MEKKLETRNTTSEGSMAKRIVVVLFSLLEVILGFRLVFKLMGANPSNVFVNGLYGFTQFFVGVFEGIFSKVTTTGAETKAIFEPGTLIAMIIVGLIAWGVLKLMSQNTSSQVKKTEVVEENPDQLK